MGFFGDDNNNDVADLFSQLPGQLFKCGKLILGGLKPAIRDVQKLRGEIALARANKQMNQMVQSPGSPCENPVSQVNSVATANLSPPPKRNKQC